MQEEWKDIVGYEGLYQISSLGRVMSLGRTTTGNKGSIMKLQDRMLKITYSGNNSGTVCLAPIEGAKFAKTHSVAKIVYSHFIGNISKDDRITHKNLNLQDNSATNLLKCSKQEFMQWLWDTKQCNSTSEKAVFQISNNVIIKRFNSIVDAYKFLN